MSKRAVIICTLGLAIFTLGLSFAHSQEKTPPGPVLATPLGVGRFQLVVHPEVGKFQYLLDTVDGRIWVATLFDGGTPQEFAGWRRMPRIDTLNDTEFEIEFRTNFGVEAWERLKRKTASEPTTSAPSDTGN